MCSYSPITRLIPMDQSNCALLCLYGTCVESYIYGIFHGTHVEYTMKMYQNCIPYRVYYVSTSNQQKNAARENNQPQLGVLLNFTHTS